MKLLQAIPTFWCSFLVLLVSQSEADGNLSDVCQSEHVMVLNASGLIDIAETTSPEEAFVCLFDPSSRLTCSWSFQTLQNDAQLSVIFSDCKNENLVDFKSFLSVEKVGSESWIFNEDERNEVIVRFNKSQNDKWTVYTKRYEIEDIRLLPPPANINASIKNGDLYVSWSLPFSKRILKPVCFGYQLDLGYQEQLRNLTDTLSYTELNAVPSHTYRVRIRTAVMDHCRGCYHWSEWSPTVTVEQPSYTLDPWVIVGLSLGIPMILLAVLLLVRHQRLTKVLFPPIPRPPPEYKNFLEKSDHFSFFHPPPAKHEEEITEVEDAEQNPGKTF